MAPNMAEVDEDLSQYPDRLVEAATNRAVLITGGTGFLGKVLVEKMLRYVDITNIYLLVRPKKGKSPKERLTEIFNNPLFDLLKSVKPGEIEKKVILIAGDCSLPDLGLSSTDRELIKENVEFIFHCAATIRFDEDLKPAVLLNVRGTKLMLELAKECKKLLVFCHLSTAYCHLRERVLQEKAYPPPADPEAIIRTCELLSTEDVNAIAPKILKDIPNSYAFTKALAEATVVKEIDNLPVIVLRPSIIIPIWLEPIPGWTDNINGPTGLLIGAGKGVIRTMYSKKDAYADYIPVDIVVNCMAAAVCDYCIFKSTRRIYNLTSSAEYKISFEEIIEIGRKVVETKVPLNGVFWYPGGSMKYQRWQHLLAFYLFQWIPAVVVDALLVLLGYKPVLMRVQRRIWKGYEVFEYYTSRQWDFDNEGSMKARHLLNPREKKLYKLDGDGVNYDDYFTNCTIAARRYILKETDDTIPAARRHMTVMWWADRISKTIIMLGLFYFMVTKIVAPLLGI